MVERGGDERNGTIITLIMSPSSAAATSAVGFRARSFLPSCASLLAWNSHAGGDIMHMPRALWWCYGEGEFSYERGSPVGSYGRASLLSV